MPRKSTGRPPGRPRHPEPLTPAEQRVLQHIRAGRPNAEIAAGLGVSLDAVKYHVSNMLGKLGFESREQLAAWQEPSRLGRTWSGLVGLGWKAAIVGGAVAAGVVVLTVALVAFRGGGDENESAFGADELMTGVLSVGMDGEPADGPSTNPSISGDGRYVAFESEATNLVPDDTNGVSDIFVTDRLTGETRRVSNGMDGQQANGASHRPAISADGKWVAFDSEASNLVPGDVNGEFDRAFALLPEQVRSQFEGDSRRMQDMRAIAPRWAGMDVFVVSVETLESELVSVTDAEVPGNLASAVPVISADGRFVAFESTAPNLLGEPVARGGPPAGTGGLLGLASDDVYLRDRQSKTTTRISQPGPDGIAGLLGSAGVSISADGSRVAFVSHSSQLADEEGPYFQNGAAYVWDRQSGLKKVPFPVGPPEATHRFVPVTIIRSAISPAGDLVALPLSIAYSGSGPGTESSLGGIWLYRLGEPEATLISGTERFDNGWFPLSFDEQSTILVTPVAPEVASGTAMQGGAVYDLKTGELRPMTLTSEFEGSWRPIVSSDGHWIVATQYTGTRPTGGPPDTEIGVFPR